MKLGIYVSGNGTNLQAIIDAIKSSYLKNTKIVVVISNNNKSNALLRAHKAMIPICYFDNDIIDIEGSKILQKHNIDLIVLAGYLRKIGPKTLEVYKERIINIHPALLPKYSGKGMYGIKVHEKVIKSGDKETGITIHWVDEKYDTGSIIKQVRIPIYKNDTAQLLNKRVLKIEHKIIVDTLIELNNKKEKLMKKCCNNCKNLNKNSDFPNIIATEEKFCNVLYKILYTTRRLTIRKEYLDCFSCNFYEKKDEK